MIVAVFRRANMERRRPIAASVRSAWLQDVSISRKSVSSDRDWTLLIDHEAIAGLLIYSRESNNKFAQSWHRFHVKRNRGSGNLQILQSTAVKAHRMFSPDIDKCVAQQAGHDLY